MIKNNSEKLKFNIQLFSDTADNGSEEYSVDVNNAGDNEEIIFTDGALEGDTEDKKITTKAFSERLKREKSRIERELEEKKNEDLNKIAIARGYKTWQDYEQSIQNERLENLGINDSEAFNSYVETLISNNPIVREAKSIIDTNKERENEANLNAAVNEINKLDSDIKSINDLIALENYDEFYALVERGYTLPNAYKIVAFDKLANKKAMDAIIKTNSKNHLGVTKGVATKDVVVPDEVYTTYKKNNPRMTDEQIREHYGKYVGGN